MKKTTLLLIGFLFLILEIRGQTVTDIDGNTYNTIIIGTQTWMKENLKTTRFTNGDIIGTTSMSINNDSTSIYQWFYNEDSLNYFNYGRLYTWYAVNDIRYVCPAGWHVPSETEWITLTNFLGGDTIAGGKMKETGTAHWLSTDSTVTNSSWFTGLPGGFRGNPGGFINIYTMGHFWSSTQWGSDSFRRAYIFKLQYNNSALEQSVAVANCGLSVRCLKDITANTEQLFPEDKIRIFPNPTNDNVYISFEESGKFNTSIYDITGTLVFREQLTNKINLINLNFLPKGVYIIKIVGEDMSVVRKLVKE